MALNVVNATSTAAIDFSHMTCYRDVIVVHARTVWRPLTDPSDDAVEDFLLSPYQGQTAPPEPSLSFYIDDATLKRYLRYESGSGGGPDIDGCFVQQHRVWLDAHLLGPSDDYLLGSSWNYLSIANTGFKLQVDAILAACSMEQLLF